MCQVLQYLPLHLILLAGCCVRALIMLGNIANGRFEAAEIENATREMMLLVIEAQEQLWADMRVNA